MRDCHLKHTSDRVLTTCGHMPRLIPSGSLSAMYSILFNGLNGHKVLNKRVDYNKCLPLTSVL